MLRGHCKVSSRCVYLYSPSLGRLIINCRDDLDRSNDVQVERVNVVSQMIDQLIFTEHVTGPDSLQTSRSVISLFVLWDLPMHGMPQAAVGIWNLMQSYRRAQLSPTLAFRSAMILSTPRVLRRAARAAPLKHSQTQTFHVPMATNLFPAPMIKTCVSISPVLPRHRPGDRRRD